MTTQQIQYLLDIKIKDVNSIQNFAHNLQKILDDIKLNPRLESDFKDIFTNLTNVLDRVKKQVDSGIFDQKGLNNFKSGMNEAISLINQLKANTLRIQPNQWALALDVDPKSIEQYNEAIEKAINAQKNFRNENTNLQASLKLLEQAEKEIRDANKDPEQYASFKNLKKALEEVDFNKINQILNGFKKIGAISETTKSDIVTNVQAARDTFINYNNIINTNTESINKAKLAQSDYAATVGEQVVNAERDAANAATTYKNDLEQTSRSAIDASRGVEQLINRLTNFLSIGNAIHLLTRTIRSALGTIKELDAAMTETATVTEYSVSQMWQKLDDYTNVANQLGATTLGTYKTITLFFQQGLDEVQSLALATETMKMARVANIDYAEATQYMTSALRGFNMELDEVSATRVNDVYSELAKITAADTQQIAIAMSKVASLANSANMELETTSAFLSQIIETTQEAPETAGTALKTIIARFSEVKKLFREGELTGSDTEGEAIDVNKISVALRTAGIDLNQFILGNVGLDEIFMQLAEKWDSLTLVQQRYIATQAAGSRQQSRFIAMMQDYGRTVELVNAAYNSAGSGQEQFDKTLESIEAKINQLKNSWNSFTMSIANSDAIKAGVDALNGLLTIINKITDAFGAASGAMKLFLASGIGTAAGQLLTPALKAMSQNFSGGGNLTTALMAAGGTFENSIDNVKAGLLGMIDPEIAQQQHLKNLQDEYNNLDQTAQDYVQTEARLKKQIDEANASLDKTLMTGKKIGRNFQIVGLAATALGEHLKKVSDNLDDEKNKRYVESLGQVLSIFGQLTLGVGTLIRTFPGLSKAIGEVMAGLSGTQIGLIIAAIAAAITAISALTAHVKEQKQALEDWDNMAQKIQDDLIGMADGAKQFTSAAEQLNKMKRGTLEWAVQIERVKKIYNDLIEMYPALEPYLYFNANTGSYNFDEIGFTKETKRQQALSEKNTRYEAIEPLDIYDAIKWNSRTYDNTSPALEETLTKEKLLELYPWLGTAADDVYGTLLEKLIEEADAGYNADTLKQKMEEIYGEKNATWDDMNFFQLYSEYIDMFFDNWIQQFYNELVKSGKIKDRLTDLKGQNIYATYGGDYTQEGQKKLGEQLDLGLEGDASATALYGYWKTLEELPDTLKEDTNALKGLALETASAFSHFEDLNKVLKQNKDILASGQKDAENYGVAVGEIWAIFKDTFGSSMSYEFVRDNIDKILEAFRDGSEEALQEIQTKLIDTFDISSFLEEQQKDFEVPITLGKVEVQTIRDTLEELTQDREFQLTGVGDFTALWTLLTKTYGIAEDVANAMMQQFMIQGILVDDGDGNFHYQVSNLGHQGVLNAKASGGAGKKSKGSSKKEKAWENPYDQLYNLTERNEEAIRQRNILEKEYNALLRDRESEANSLVKLSLQELANLQEQLAYQKQLQAGRLKQLSNVNKETWTDSEGNRKSYDAWGVTQYASYNQETKAIEIDWDAIDKVTDETKGKAIEDYIKRLEELQKEFEQTDEDILDIEAEIDEINRRSKDDFLSLEQRVYDAIVKQHQEVIDAYSSFNDTLNDTNDKIMDGLREQIDLERQIRDNTQTEQDIAEKEARLAYLQRDTSGANATETLKLQKEIDDARQSYSDSLIDQQIDSIEKGNEKAAEQRQIQIQTMQAQLDYWTKIGAFWSTVSDLLTNAIDPETGKLDENNSALVSLLMSEENFGGLSEFGQMDWYDDLVEAFNKGMEGFGNFKMQQAEEAGEITQGGNTYKYDKEKKAWMLGNEAYSAVYDPVTGQYIFTRNKTEDVKTGTIGEPKEEIKADKEKESQESPTPPPSTSTPVESYTVTYNNGEWSTTVKAKSATDAINMASELYKKAMGFGSNFPAVAWKGKAVATKLNGTLRYASGGMANFTGPAWLDGTKSKPEAVLSAKQTELFISLRDMLERFGQSGGFNNSYGNTYVDLDVNADIGSDYDVDSLVSRLKRDILESSSYRNVNMLSRGH